MLCIYSILFYSTFITPGRHVGRNVKCLGSSHTWTPVSRSVSSLRYFYYVSVSSCLDQILNVLSRPMSRHLCLGQCLCLAKKWLHHWLLLLLLLLLLQQLAYYYYQHRRYTTQWVKKTSHHTVAQISAKYWTIFQILLQAHSTTNLQ